MTTSTSNNKNNVIDIFTQKPYSSSFNQRIIRLAPELDGLEMIYSNETNPEKLFNTKILCWALRANGEVIGLTPWLDKIAPCPLINVPVDRRWEGYFDPSSDEVFHDAPIHKIIELCELDDACSSYLRFADRSLRPPCAGSTRSLRSAWSPAG